jgi:haloalkane dehalogenase
LSAASDRYSAEDHAAALRRLVRHLDLSDLVVMGQDWGGPIGLRVAADEPERISGLILGSTFAWPLEGLIMRFFAWVLRTRLMQRYMVESDRFAERVIRGLTRRRLDGEELRHYRAVGDRHAFAALPRQLRDGWLSRLEADCRERLRDRPTLLLMGRESRFLERPYVRRFQELFENHRLVELRGAGHFFQEDAPAEVAAAVRQMFQDSR